MQWKTKITELLGCKYPILQGATERIGTWLLRPRSRKRALMENHRVDMQNARRVAGRYPTLPGGDSRIEVMMGSAFLTTKECPIADEFKERMLQLRLSDRAFRTRVLVPAPFDRGGANRPSSAEPDWNEAASFAVASVDRILNVKELVEKIIREAADIRSRWSQTESR